MTLDSGVRYLSIKEVAKLLGFHPETIKRWARDGKIKVQQVGHYGHIRVKWPLEILSRQKIIQEQGAEY
jgi:excisionase family DNA binding protein